ncbi:MAG TPA: hypothetical protein VHP33_33645 [Polyangiaceae bacterium]|nr:hypothetical protein [Polyangiaceae bacterium]
MSKTETDLPARMRIAGASPLEQRLLRAAGSELPSRALSERMARGLGIALPVVGSGAAVGAASKAAVAAPKAASVGSSLLPWVSGALVAAVVAGAFLAARPSATQSVLAPAGSAAAFAPVPSASAPAPAQVASAPTQLTEAPSKGDNAESLKAALPPASPRVRRGTTASDLANQIALIDAARAALAGGDSARALASVRDYQSGYPNGSFNPEVAAIKIEALLKLGRKAEARALAERFSANYGPGPLTDRVTRLLGAGQP